MVWLTQKNGSLGCMLSRSLGTCPSGTSSVAHLYYTATIRLLRSRHHLLQFAKQAIHARLDRVGDDVGLVELLHDLGDRVGVVAQRLVVERLEVFQSDLPAP